ncbi:3-hydroxyacyl-CoA dehydrogenase NAD-binding domain-containing protein [Kitasatospora sp. NPDC001540]|uniref:3-hydroxyacyl-CoA dehydrogenase NAD-binding domain-containing protein n=1 Tax=Kitasatospora sp. NPDC001540 TaxID=3364014 RepID=UPI0036B874A0
MTIVGAGVIGMSWARLFAGADWEVRVSDPRPDLAEVVARELPGLAVTATGDLAAAADGADFVQEAGPERIDVKKQVFAALAAHTREDVVLASSSSSLLPSVIAEGNAAADRLVIGHPFNPPELMPLVEVVPGPQTSARALDRAMDVYRGLGKLPILLKKEIPGFVGNRLQKVFNDQATYLVQQGVIDVADLDDLVRASLGLRWATVGPFQSGVLGGGPAGMRHLVEHVGSQLSFEIGRPDPERTGEVLDAVEQAYGTGEQAYRRLVALRDRRTSGALAPLDWTGGRAGSGQGVGSGRTEGRTAGAGPVGAAAEPPSLLALQPFPGRVLKVSIPDGRVETLVEDAGAAPDGIVVDSGTVYWTTMGAPEVDPGTPGEGGYDFSRRNGGVHAWSPGQGVRRDVVADGAMTTGKQLTSDGAGTLYWSDREGHRVSRVRTDGSGLTDLVVTPASEGIPGECVGVAVDPVGGYLYWTQKGPAKGGQGRILRAGLELPDGRSAEHRTDIEVLWSGLPEPIDLHVDGGWLYWTDRGAAPHGNTLNRAPVPAPGAAGGTPEILADGFAEAIGLAVDGGAGLAYVADLGGHIREVPLPDGPAADRAPREVVALGAPLTGLCLLPRA